MDGLSNIFLPDAQATFETGRRLGEHLLECFKGGRLSLPFLITLEGDLGTGKTTFSQGLCRALGVTADQEVVSPTFTLANEYKGVVDIFHLDVYRLNQEEFYEAGLDEYLTRPGISLVEWPDKMPDNFWPPRLRMTLSFKDGGRMLNLRGNTTAVVIQRLKTSVF